MMGLYSSSHFGQINEQYKVKITCVFAFILSLQIILMSNKLN